MNLPDILDRVELRASRGSGNRAMFGGTTSSADCVVVEAGLNVQMEALAVRSFFYLLRSSDCHFQRVITSVCLGKRGHRYHSSGGPSLRVIAGEVENAQRAMEGSHSLRVSAADREGAWAQAVECGPALAGEQRSAFEHVTDERGLSLVVGYAGTGTRSELQSIIRNIANEPQAIVVIARHAGDAKCRAQR